MNKLILVFTLFINFSNAWAKIELDFEDDNTPEVSATNLTAGGTFNEMIVDSGSNTLSSPHEVYIPIRNTTNLADINAHHTFNSDNDVPEILLADAGSTSADRQRAVVNLHLNITPDSSDARHLYAVVQWGDDSANDEFQIVADINGNAKIRTFFTTSAQNDIDIKFNIGDLCFEGSIKSGEVCKELDNQGAGDNLVTKKVKMFLFLSDENYGVGDNDIDIDEHSDGLFVQLNLSSEVPESAATLNTGAPILDNAESGDSEVSINLADTDNVDISSSDFHGIYFFNLGSVQSAQDYSAVRASRIDYTLGEDIREEDNKPIVLKDLINSQVYYIGLAYVNKYQLASDASNTIEARPLEIEAFLESQTCYFVSAGFKEEHYVLQYFKYIRDRYLLKTYFGKKLVHLYYSSAKQYARVIWFNPKLSALVRFISYGVYYVMNYFYQIFLTIIGLLFIRKFYLKNGFPRNGTKVS